MMTTSGMKSSVRPSRSINPAYAPSGAADCHECHIPPNHSSCESGKRNEAARMANKAIRFKRCSLSLRNNKV